MDWKKTKDSLPIFYRPVLTDQMHSSALTPTGWNSSVPPKSWAYIPDALYAENQWTIDEWHGKRSLRESVNRLVAELGELVSEIVSEKTSDQVMGLLSEVSDHIDATPEKTFNVKQVAERLANIEIILNCTASSVGVDLHGAVDEQMEIYKHTRK